MVSVCTQIRALAVALEGTVHVVRRNSDESKKSIPIHYSVDQPNNGPGMFVSSQALASRDRCLKLVGSLHGHPLNIKPAIITAYPFADFFEKICDRYWSDASHFMRESITQGDYQKFKKLQVAAGDLLYFTQFQRRFSMPDPTKERDRAKMVSVLSRDPAMPRLASLFGRSLKNHQQEFAHNLPMFQRNLYLLAKLELPRNPKKGKPDSVHINRATAKLCEMWKQIGGSPVDRNPEIAPGKNGLEFVKPEPQWMLEVLKQIDSDIDASQVRTAFKLLASVKRQQAPK
jgi:hypothetical protein